MSEEKTEEKEEEKTEEKTEEKKEAEPIISWFPPIEPLSAALARIIPSEKRCIYLISELHKFDKIGYDLQISIINDNILKFGKENVIIYTETPEEEKAHIRDPQYIETYMASAVISYADEHDIEVVFSVVNAEIRQTETRSKCNVIYASDILAERRDKKCCIVICGLFHIWPLYSLFTKSYKNYNHEEHDIQTFNAIGINKLLRFIPTITDSRGGPRLTEKNFTFLQTFSIIERDDYISNSIEYVNSESVNNVLDNKISELDGGGIRRKKQKTKKNLKNYKKNTYKKKTYKRKPHKPHSYNKKKNRK